MNDLGGKKGHPAANAKARGRTHFDQQSRRSFFGKRRKFWGPKKVCSKGGTIIRYSAGAAAAHHLLKTAGFPPDPPSPISSALLHHSDSTFSNSSGRRRLADLSYQKSRRSRAKSTGAAMASDAVTSKKSIDGIYIPAGLIVIGTVIVKREWTPYAILAAMALELFKYFRSRKLLSRHRRLRALRTPVL